ncbi:MAG TPA: type II toxin-antitoxin system RelE/ParE family toxin [Gemmataceae bacterium]
MTVRVVIIHRLAGRELRRAARRYGATSPAREQRFRAAVGQALQRIATAADLCPPWRRRFRWVKPHKFSYTIYFQILSDAEAIVWAVAPDGRRPGYWLGRVRRP